MGVSAGGMKVLIVGSGAREHALAWACARSERVRAVFVAPGNAGTPGVASNVAIKVDDVSAQVRFAKSEAIDLAVLGPESAVAAGLGDALREAGFSVFGPDRGAGQIETSKSFAKAMMKSCAVPTAEFGVFTEARPAKLWAREHAGQVAVKADGLALGKGVTVCASVDESDAAIEALLVRKTLGWAGQRVVIEERLTGPELSVFGVSDGRRVIALQAARDYKRARDGDAGPNTGGMGAYSPALGVTDGLVEEARRSILEPAIAGLAEAGFEYRGVLYAGLMLTPAGLRCIEFNARFGDPEAQVLLPRMESDLVDLMLAAAEGDLDQAPPISWTSRAAVAVVMASQGYPDSHQTGHPISGLADLPQGVMAFHGATRFDRDQGLVTAGGRVLTLVGLGEDVATARAGALAGVARVAFRGEHHRTDIAMEAEGQ